MKVLLLIILGALLATMAGNKVSRDAEGMESTSVHLRNV